MALCVDSVLMYVEINKNYLSVYLLKLFELLDFIMLKFIY